MAGAKVKDMIVTTTTVSLDIPLHKTAQGGQTELTRRTFRCVCVSAAHPLCPIARLGGTTDASWRRRPVGLTTSSSRPGLAYRGPRSSRRRCSGWCSTRPASRPASSTSMAGPALSSAVTRPAWPAPPFWRRSSSADGRRRQSSAMCSRRHWQWRRASRPSARRAGRGDPGGRLLGARTQC